MKRMRGEHGDGVRVLAGGLPVERVGRELGDRLSHVGERAAHGRAAGGQERVWGAHEGIVLRSRD